MTSNESFRRLQEIFYDVFDDDEIELTTETTAEDIDDWDSLSHIRLIVAVEKVFNVKFSVGEIERLENVGQFVVLLESKL